MILYTMKQNMKKRKNLCVFSRAVGYSISTFLFIFYLIRDKTPKYVKKDFNVDTWINI